MRMLKVVDFSKFVTGTPVEEFDDDERMPEESVDGMQNEDAGGMPKEGVTGMPREGVSGMPKEGANGVPLKADARRMSEAEKAASGRLEDEGMRKKLISAEKIKDIKSNPQATVKDIKETLGLMLTESEASK